MVLLFAWDEVGAAFNAPYYVIALSKSSNRIRILYSEIYSTYLLHTMKIARIDV